MAKLASGGVFRRVRPWLVGWAVFQVAVAVTGRLLAWRSDEGDESSTSIRRTLTHNGMQLRPTSPRLSRLRIDLGMAGGEVDLTGIPQPSGGIDLTAHVLMGGLAVRVPTDWRVWWRFRGIGGIGTDATIARTHDEHSADLRIDATVVFGGIGVEGPPD